MTLREAPRHARPMTEAELQSIVIKEAQRKGWAVHCHQQGSSKAPGRSSQVRSNNGYPDLTLARDDEVLFLELKAQDGKVDADQVRWMMALPRYEVIRPSDLARGRVDELLA